MTTVVTSGVFSSTNPAISPVNGVGTDYIQWGSAGSQSGYQFRGDAADVQLGGTEFVIGTFIHRNKPTTVSPDQFDVQLTINVMFEDGSTTDLNFSFHHNETPNSTGTSPADDDLVDLQTFIHPQPVTVDGKQYRAVLSGFKRNGQIVRQFRSPEGGINFAEVVCMFALDEPDVIISGLRYQGTSAGQADEYVEIFNQGGAPQDLTGWQVEAKPTGYSFPFPRGRSSSPASATASTPTRTTRSTAASPSAPPTRSGVTRAASPAWSPTTASSSTSPPTWTRGSTRPARRKPVRRPFDDR
ncbi:choice-of-anchor K domain-containing protein [Streptomyces nogalater]